MILEKYIRLILNEENEVSNKKKESEFERLYKSLITQKPDNVESDSNESNTDNTDSEPFKINPDISAFHYRINKNKINQ